MSIKKKQLVIIIGLGGHSKVLLEILKQKSFKIIGYTDKTKNCIIAGIPYLGNDEKVLDFSPKDIFLVNGIGYPKRENVRKKKFKYFKEKKYNFLTLKHSNSIISNNVKCSEGSQIMAGSVIQPGCIIGKNSIINTLASIDHDCIIGDNVHIAPGAILCGNVKIGNNSFIGAGSIIVPNISIKSNSFIKAGEKIFKSRFDV